MIFTTCRGCQIYDFATVPWLIVVAFTFLTVAMSDVVCIVLLEFLTVDVMLFRELLLPEYERLIHRKSYSFEVKTELKSSKMFQVMMVFKCCVKSLHTGREGLARVEV